MIIFVLASFFFRAATAIDLPTRFYNSTYNAAEISQNKCDYFIEKNSTEMLDDVFTYLNISKENLAGKASKLDNNFASKYSNGICDLRQFLTDLNSTAELELSLEQINKLEAAVESFNADIKDVIIKPDKPMIFYSALDRIVSSIIPRDQFIGSQSAPYLLGNTEVVTIFVGNNEVLWGNEINNVLTRILDATSWLKSQSPDNANVNFNIGYFISQISSDPNNCDLDNANCACNLWMEEAVQNLGTNDDNNDGRYTDDLVNFIKLNTNADNVALVYIIKESGLFASFAGYACPYPFFGTAERTAIYYKLCFITCKLNGIDVYAHELLHLFGACDEYKGCGEFAGCNSPCIFSYTPIYDKYPNANCYDCNPNGQPCIMRGEGGSGASFPELAIEYYTRGQIGWGDYDSDGIIDPKDSCPLVFGDGIDGCPNTEKITEIICNKQTTNCQKSCKKCPSNYDYCEYEWTSSCGSKNGIIDSGYLLPKLACNKKSTCAVRGCN